MPEYLFTRSVFVAILAWSLFVHYGDSLNNRTEGYILRFGIVLVAHLFLYSFWWIAKKAILDYIKPSWIPIPLLIVIAIGGALRGLLFQYMLNNSDLSLQINYTQRAITSLFNITLVATMAILVVANLQVIQSSRTRLLIEADRLKFANSSSELAMKDFSSETAQRIKSELLNKVSEIRNSSIPAILVGIRSMIDEVVRPLTRNLDNALPTWVPPTIDPREHRIRLRSAFKQSASTSYINYLFVPIFMAITALPSILARTSLATGLVVFPLSIFVVALWCYFVARVVSRMWDSLFAYFFLTALNGIIFGFSTLTYTYNFSSPFVLFASAIGFYSTWSIVVSFLKTLFRLNIEANQKLDEFTNELAWQVAYLRETSFQSQRKLAAALHGQVQAKLASTYLQLGSINEHEEGSDKKARSLLDELEKTIEGIDSADKNPHDLNQLFQKVVENWSNVAHIQMLAEPQIIAQIQRDQICASTLMDLIPELCFNSIKHGKATQISVDFKFKSDRVLELIVSNDGSVEETSSGIGLGGKLLNEVSIFWERKTEGERAVTRVDLAYRAA